MTWLKTRFWLQLCLKTNVLLVMGASPSVNHSRKSCFFPADFLKLMEKDAENRRVRRLKQEKKATGLWFSVSDAWLHHIFHSFNITFCLFNCSSERQGEWSLCKRRLWNCGEVLHRRFNWTAGHAALVHQSGTSEFSFFKHFIKKQIKLNSLIKHCIVMNPYISCLCL